MAKKRARETDGATEAPDKMVDDGDSSDDEVRLPFLTYGLPCPQPTMTYVVLVPRR